MPDTREPRSEWTPVFPLAEPSAPSRTDSPSVPPRTVPLTIREKRRLALIEKQEAHIQKTVELADRKYPQTRLPKHLKAIIRQKIKNGTSVAMIHQEIVEQFGISVPTRTIYRYQSRARVDADEEELNGLIAKIQISSRYYRMMKRQIILERLLPYATSAKEFNHLAVREVRSLLIDAAKEMGHLEPNVQINNFGGDINLTQIALIQKIQSLTNEQLRAYVEHGELPLPAGVSPTNGNGHKVIEANPVEANGTANNG